MFTEEEKRDLIGVEVGILDALGHEYAKITIAEIKTIDDEDIIISTDGVAYSDEQINWSYRLTLGGICMLWLEKQGYLNEDVAFSMNGHEYENQLNVLLDSLVENGFLGIDDEPENSKTSITIDDVMSSWLYRFGYISAKDIRKRNFKEDFNSLIDIMQRAGYIN